MAVMTVMVALAALSATAAAAWTRSGPIPGAFVASLAYNADGSVLYAGGIGKVFRSTDNGGSWTASDLPAAYYSSVVISVAISPLDKNLVLASTWDVSLPTNYDTQYGPEGDAVFVSSDGGVTWTLTDLPNQVESDDSQYPYYPVWDPLTKETAYAGTGGYDGNGAVYRTTNGGKTWSLVYSVGDINQPFLRGPMAAAPTKPVSLYFAAEDFNYASDGLGYIAQSTNGAVTISTIWPLNYIGFPGYGPVLTAFASDPKNPKIVYALASGYNDGTLDNFESLQFLYSPNNGVNWESPKSGLPEPNTVFGTALAVDPTSRAVLLPLCCEPHNELYSSKDFGATWSAVAGVETSVASLAARPGLSITVPAMLAAAGQGGVLVSADAGAHWATRNDGLSPANIADLVADPTKTTILYVGTKAGVWRSTNGGTSFTEIDDNLTDRQVEALALDSKAATHVLYAATSTGVYRCENPAAVAPVWTEITPEAKHVGDFGLAVDGATAGSLYVSTNLHLGGDSNVSPVVPREIYHSDDYGTHWTLTAFNSVTGNDIPQAIIADPKTPGTLYAAAEVETTVYKSINGGKSFVQILNAEGNQFVWGQADSLNPRTLYLLTTNADTGQSQILRSTNGGQLWDSDATTPPNGGNILRLAADPSSSRIFALTLNTLQVGEGQDYVLYLYESVNRGITWTNIVGKLGSLCNPCSAGLNGGFTVPTVTSNPSIWATGKTLAVSTPLSPQLFMEPLP
ncbi:MAG TPA: hypothetical protein VME69_08265 [Methylocella sp.]|nr:hypothetical protein [Methylocella sp.]